MTGCLEGRRVVELADASGVYCGKLFADLGADVIKVERPGGDATRAVRPFFRDEPGPDHSLFFLYMNTNKRGVTLDLERHDGRELFARLVATADVLVETTRPGTLEGLGLGYDDLRRERPSLVHTSITGFGQTGPHRDFQSSDLVASAMGGAMYVIGEEDDPPVALAGSQAYQMASTNAAVASLVALHHAANTGQGQHVDISMQETQLSVAHITGVGKWLDDGIVPRRRGAGLFASVPSGTYRCRDGLVYLMVNRPAHWQALARWIHEETGNEEVVLPLFEGPSSVRQEHRELLDLFIHELTERHTVDEIYHEGQRRHIAFTPLHQPGEVLRDAHLAARGFFVDLEHPATGPLRYPGPPYRHDATPAHLERPAPRIGEHNEAVFVGELGLAPERFAALAAQGVL